MSLSYFIWNGKDCRSMGIIMDGPAAIIRPEERVKHVEIPGESGDLTETEGENIYNSYIQTANIIVRGGFRVGEIYDWLRGAGYVTFSGEPDKKQKARVIGAITLNKAGHNLDYWRGECQFYCQPLKERMAEEKVTVSASGAVVRNNGDVICKPMWKVVPSAATAKIKAAGAGITGDNEITITGLTSGVAVWVDSDTMEVWNADKTALLTKNSTGDFPVLGQGSNTVTGEGWSSLEIQKRERYL